MAVVRNIEEQILKRVGRQVTGKAERGKLSER